MYRMTLEKAKTIALYDFGTQIRVPEIDLDVTG